MNIKLMKSTLNSWALTKNEINKLYIFGSWARGENTPNSDLDIGIVLDKNVVKDITFFWFDISNNWENELNSLIQYEIDLQLYDSQSQIIKSGIERSNILIYNKRIT